MTRSLSSRLAGPMLLAAACLLVAACGPTSLGGGGDDGAPGSGADGDAVAPSVGADSAADGGAESDAAVSAADSVSDSVEQTRQDGGDVSPAGKADATVGAPAKKGYYLPFACGKRVKVTQGNMTSFSHVGTSAYAFDFSLGLGTAMRAMAPGAVSYVYNKTKPGDACYSGGGPSCITKANQVWVKHADGTQTIYAHLSSVKVALGQKIARGQTLGSSGSSGYSTGPHAHVARMRSCCQTIALTFADVKGSGVPKTGDMVVSGNCP